jgi:uncharacterized protein with gpF-like domain
MNMIVAAATLPPQEARALIRVMCRQSTPAERARTGLKKRFKNSLMRVLKFAKHETLRKLHQYIYRNRELKGAEANPQHPGAIQVGFDLDALRRDMEALYHIELPGILAQAADAATESVGGEVFILPQQNVLDFIARRQNLLAGVPQEIFDLIRNEISIGLTSGETIKQLSKRITGAFDQIIETRAETIAINESAAAYAFASDKANRAAGVKYKKWLHGGSKVPRPDHLAIDGLVVPIDETFPVGTPPLMYPHDGNGSADDVINCSCIAVAAPRSEYHG